MYAIRSYYGDRFNAGLSTSVDKAPDLWIGIPSADEEMMALAQKNGIVPGPELGEEDDPILQHRALGHGPLRWRRGFRCRRDGGAGQEAGKIARIGWLTLGSPGGPFVESFRQGSYNFV